MCGTHSVANANQAPAPTIQARPPAYPRRDARPGGGGRRAAPSWQRAAPQRAQRHNNARRAAGVLAASPN